jgi:hypothetical protein
MDERGLLFIHRIRYMLSKCVPCFRFQDYSIKMRDSTENPDANRRRTMYRKAKVYFINQTVLGDVFCRSLPLENSAKLRRWFRE